MVAGNLLPPPPEPGPAAGLGPRQSGLFARGATASPSPGVLESAFPMRYLDLAVVLMYLIGITWFGARFRQSQKTLKDYFLGGRNAPWWAISLSIVSAETSTLTIIGTPTLAFAGNLGFLQVVFGYLLARIVISVLFIPHYFRGEMYTAYELMERRFGQRLRRLTAATFLVIRALAEGVRVFAISIVISIVLGTGEIASIVLILCLTLFYTFEGGMTAVIWTDVVQMCLYVFGAVLSFFVILHNIPGGWGHVLAVAGPAGKFGLFDFSFHLSPAFFTQKYTFCAAHRRLLSDYGQPRHRAVDGAAATGSPFPGPESRGATGQLGGGFPPVQPVLADRRDPVCVLFGSVLGFPPAAPSGQGFALPRLHLGLSADRGSGPGGGSNPGGCHVESQRGSEFPSFDDHH